MRVSHTNTPINSRLGHVMTGKMESGFDTNNEFISDLRHVMEVEHVKKVRYRKIRIILGIVVILLLFCTAVELWLS